MDAKVDCRRLSCVSVEVRRLNYHYLFEQPDTEIVRLSRGFLYDTLQGLDEPGWEQAA